jgi:hypothetical protein
MLVVGLVGGMVLSPGRASGGADSDLGAIAKYLERMSSSLKEIANNTDRSPVCECRCK